MEQCSNNDDHHTFIYSQLKDHNDDDSIGNASGSVPHVQRSSMIMQWQYENDGTSHETEWS